MLLMGFYGAFRRSELIGLDVGDVELKREGLLVRIRRSKTDQDGAGSEIGLPYQANPEFCPVRALGVWRVVLADSDGPLFRPVDRHGNIGEQRLTAQSVALVIKRCAQAAGLDPKQFSGHSLRSGFVTAAAMAGVTERTIMDQTRHRSVAMVRRYVRKATVFQDNAAAKVAL